MRRKQGLSCVCLSWNCPFKSAAPSRMEYTSGSSFSSDLRGDELKLMGGYTSYSQETKTQNLRYTYAGYGYRWRGYPIKKKSGRISNSIASPLAIWHEILDLAFAGYRNIWHSGIFRGNRRIYFKSTRCLSTVYIRSLDSFILWDATYSINKFSSLN
mgnify:CR=1 FL=1